MTSFFRSNQIDLNTKYKTIGPGKILNTFYRTNQIDISNNFTLYMHGTVSPTSFFRTKNIDIGNLLQVDNFTRAVELSPNTSNMIPWNNTKSQLEPAKWIWDRASAATTAPGLVYFWFYYSFYYSGSGNTGTIYIAADNYSTTYINGGTGIESTGFNTNTTLNRQFTILNGFNYIRTSAYNAEGNTNNPAGLIIAVYDSNSIYVCGTNNTWAMSTSSAYNTGALPYNR